MLPNFSYVKARSVDDAVERLEADEPADPYAGGVRLHAGGTDLLGCLHDGVFDADELVSISGVEELRGIRERDGGGLSLGALVTLSEIAHSDLVNGRWPGLAQAAESAASPQLRNQGTLGGNLCQRPRCWYFRGDFDCAKKGGDRCYAVDGENRYHAIFGGSLCHIVHPSDTAPMLVALGARVRLKGPQGTREVDLGDFYQLPVDNLQGETVLGPGEILTEVIVPPAPDGLRTSYRKVRERGAWDFALTSVALALEMDGDTVEGGRIVLGGVAPVPWRSEPAEDAVMGRTLDAGVVAEAAAAAVEGAEPLEQNGYKVPLTRGAVEASLQDLLT